MTESREIELELRGRGCFMAALEAHSVASDMEHASTIEKEKVILSLVADSRELLEGILIESGESLDSDERLWVDRGISLACEEWLRNPEDRQLVGV